MALTVTTSSVTVHGIPKASSEFFDLASQVMAAIAVEAERPKKRDRPTVAADLEARYEGYFTEIRAALNPKPEALYFVRPAVVHATGVGGSPPVIAVPLDKIEAWWYGDPRWKGGGGGGWLVGGAVVTD